MNIIDAAVILIILLFVVLGFKRGVIRTGVGLIGTIAVLVLSFTFKDVLAKFLIEKLPFFNFGGMFNGISSINILMYELISFILIFVLLYCFLNILLSLSGIIEKVLKMTIILAIPSKILGALLGLIEGIIMAFLFAFIMFHVPMNDSAIANSKIAIVLLERTPIIGQVAVGTTLALEDIVDILDDVKVEDRDTANFKVLQTMIYYKIIDREEAQKLIDDEKITFETKVSV